MSTRLTIPLVSTNAADVTVTAWRIAQGEPVSAGQVALDVTTDKAAFEVESPVAGILLEVFAPLRSVVPIGYVVALVGQPGETDAGIAAANEALMAAHREALVTREPATPYATASAPSAPIPAPATLVSPSANAVRATPKARRLATEQGLDLARIQTETGAAIITEAVLAPYLRGA